MTLRALFIGRHGYIANYLRNKLDKKYIFSSERLGSGKLHLELKNLKPKYLIILGGIVNFKEISINIEKSWKVNVIDTISTIDVCKKFNIIPIYISSESVFDGINGFYSEESEPNPIFTYGKMKNEIENYLKNNINKYTIIRFSKVYSIKQNDNTLLWSLHNHSRKTKEKLNLSYDSCFSPVSIEYIGIAFKKIIEVNDLPKILHLSGIESYSRSSLVDLYNSIQKNKSFKINYILSKHEEIKLVSNQPKKTNLISHNTRNFLDLKPDILSENMYKIYDISETLF